MRLALQRGNALPEALDPLGQRLRTPAERRVHRGFVSAHCLVAGHDEVGAQARYSVGETAPVDAVERTLFCPGQLFLTGFHTGLWRSPPSLITLNIAELAGHLAFGLSLSGVPARSSHLRAGVGTSPTKA